MLTDAFSVSRELTLQSKKNQQQTELLETHLHDSIWDGLRVFLCDGHEAEPSKQLVGVGAGRDPWRV